MNFIKTLVYRGLYYATVNVYGYHKTKPSKEEWWRGICIFIDTFIPMLERAGVSEEAISTITSKNFTEILGGLIMKTYPLESIS